MLRKLTDGPMMGIRLIKSGFNVIHSATITSRSTRGEPLKLKAPFPYEEKKFNYFESLLDSTIVRMSQENSKLIVVEGPIGAGKSAFCQALADEFEMKFIPQPTMDHIYITPGGYDLRKLDDQLPEELRTYDHRNFCLNPFSIRAFIFQINMLYLKFYEYVNAMCHLLNTGQGVILERSFLSDYVFIKAMFENKYIDKKYLKCYLEIRENILTFFPYPHLIVYLDIPVPVVQERIKTRNYSYEQNSPALTTKYLASLEKFMKQDYLKAASMKSEILIYDWSDGGNVDVVIDDIENIDFDIMRGDKKFIDWRISRKELYNYRMVVTNTPHFFDVFFVYPWYKLEELHNLMINSYALNDLYATVPDLKFDIGYNYLVGDSKIKILFDLVKNKFRNPKFHLM